MRQGTIRLHPQHTAVEDGRRCSAGDAAEEERHARLRRDFRAKEQNRLAVGRRAESQDSSSRSHLCTLIRSAELGEITEYLCPCKRLGEIMHRLTDLERIKHSLDLVWVLVR